MKKATAVALLLIIAAYVTYAEGRSAAPRAASFTGIVQAAPVNGVFTLRFGNNRVLRVVAGAATLVMGARPALMSSFVPGTEVRVIGQLSGNQITATYVYLLRAASVILGRTPSSIAPCVPTVSSVTPDRAPNTGGVAVTLSGTCFTGATRVTFGGRPATSFRVLSDIEATAVSPTWYDSRFPQTVLMWVCKPLPLYTHNPSTGAVRCSRRNLAANFTFFKASGNTNVSAPRSAFGRAPSQKTTPKAMQRHAAGRLKLLSTGAKLNVPLYAQQTNVWCWDASSLMVIKYYRPASPLRQCDLANQGTHVIHHNCCNNPFPVICVHAGWQMLSNNGFTFSDSANALSWDDLRKQIDSNTPVLYAWGWYGGNVGHMMVAVGYYTLLGQPYVEINNPWPPQNPLLFNTGGAHESYAYAAWVDGPGYNHVTWHNWYDIVDTTQLMSHPILPQRQPPTPQFSITPPVPIGPEPIEKAAPVPKPVVLEAQRTLDALRRAPSDVQMENGLGEGAAAHARLGSPMREYIVGLNSLRMFKRGMDPARLIRDGREFFFPILVDGQVKSSVRVILTSDQRALTESIGSVTLAEDLGAIGLSGRLSESPSTATNAVRILALGLYFVARTQEGQVQLASLYGVPAYKLSKGAYQNAEDIFSILGAIARRERGAM